MRGYALTCLALVLGRLDPRRLEEVLKDIEPELLQTLMSQVSSIELQYLLSFDGYELEDAYLCYDSFGRVLGNS
jgi:hypothetical protein